MLDVMAFIAKMPWPVCKAQWHLGKMCVASVALMHGRAAFKSGPRCKKTNKKKLHWAPRHRCKTRTKLYISCKLTLVRLTIIFCKEISLDQIMLGPTCKAARECEMSFVTFESFGGLLSRSFNKTHRTD